MDEDLGFFIQDWPRKFVINNLTAVVVEGTNAYQVFLETQYDVSTLYNQGRKLEVAGG